MTLGVHIDAIEHGEGSDLTPVRGRLHVFAARCTYHSRLSTRMHREKLGQQTQVHHGCGEREELIDFRLPAQLHLANDALLLAVAEHGLDELASELAYPVSRMARRAPVDAALTIGGASGQRAT